MIDYYRLTSWGPMLLATVLLLLADLAVAFMVRSVRARLIQVDAAAAKKKKPSPSDDAQRVERAAKITANSRALRLLLTGAALLVLLDLTVMVLILAPPWLGYVASVLAVVALLLVHLLLLRSTQYPAKVAAAKVAPE